ncbi:hypothetical protein ACFWXA_35505 [Streptomyces atroolivaceus]|uniref:hypothetical protein n=1 Tax=Streptomyces atroolivaceus TaxID=66869 RepID=UPI003659D476
MDLDILPLLVLGEYAPTNFAMYCSRVRPRSSAAAAEVDGSSVPTAGRIEASDGELSFLSVTQREVFSTLSQ